jgi:hypothetical protein
MRPSGVSQAREAEMISEARNVVPPARYVDLVDRRCRVDAAIADHMTALGELFGLVSRLDSEMRDEMMMMMEPRKKQ